MPSAPSGTLTPAALASVGRVAAPGGVVFEVPERAGVQACYPRNDGAWLLVQSVGSGTVVRLGGASALVNEELGKADNGVLMASLLVPIPGTSVHVLQPPLPGGGSAGLGDLIAPRVRLALWQLVVAFVLLALWRARRLGRPVVEPQPVQLPGAELVVAVGNLMQRAKGGDAAAMATVDELCRVMGRALYNATVLLDLQRISLGGSVFLHNRELLLPELQAQLQGKLPALTNGCELVAAGLGARVGDYAALARLVCCSP